MILVADDLVPSEAIRLGRANVVGFVIESGGRTSHTSIIARSLGIPAVAGVEGVTSLVTDEDPIVVDSAEGMFLVDTLGRVFLPKALGYTAGPALASMAIFLLMSVMLYFRPAGLFPAPQSAAPAHSTAGAWFPQRWPVIAALAIALALALVPLAGETFYTRVLTRALAMGLAAIGLDLVFG